MKYNPHNYQTYATDFILSHPVSAVFLDMGLGKSVISLTAIFDLCLDSFEVRKVLVIAPVRKPNVAPHCCREPACTSSTARTSHG